MGQRPIARELGLHSHTVRRYVEAETLPERPHRVSRAGMLEPYEGYILELWRQGERNDLGLWREIVALGYPGTRGNVSRLVARLRQQERVGVEQLEPPHGLTPRQAVGLLQARPETRTSKQQATIGQLKALHSEIRESGTLLERFARMLRERARADLEQ